MEHGRQLHASSERFGIRQMLFENRLSLVTDLQGRWESYRHFLAPLNWRMESGDRFDGNVAPQGERLIQPSRWRRG